MGRYTNVVLRGTMYYLRVAIPADLKPAKARAEVWCSLRTKDERKARQAAHEKLAKMQADWSLQRERLANVESGVAILSQDQIHEIAADFYRQELLFDERRRTETPTPSDVDEARARLLNSKCLPDLDRLEGQDLELAVFSASLDFIAFRETAKFDSDTRCRLASTLRRHIAESEYALIKWAADAMIDLKRLPIAKESRDYKRLCLALLRAWIEAIDRTIERDSGNWGGAPRDPLLAAAPNTGAATASVAIMLRDVDVEAEPSISDLFERYAKENPNNVKGDTINQSRKIIALFVDSLSALRLPASGITKKEVRNWKALLQLMPVKAAEIGAFRGKTIAKVVELNQTEGRPVISAKTVNKYLSALGAFCSWLVNHGWLDVNPVDGLLVRVDRDRHPVHPYSIDELNAVFSSPLYSGCQSETEWHASGNVTFSDHRYWLPLLALFTGARMGELAQLRTADVRAQHGSWIIHITREGGEGKSTKTKGSQRVVPLHSALVDLGFVEFAKRAKAGEEARLFPALGMNARGQIAGDYSRSYGKFLEKVGVKIGPKDIRQSN